jgi:apolipoprotein N-acyltransferase
MGIPNEVLTSGSALLGLVALIPLYCALREVKTWRGAGFLGGVMMMLVHAISSFWLAYFKDFAIFTIGGSSLYNFFIGIVVGWVLRWSIRFPKHIRPFMFAMAWTIWEWFKSIGFFAYPWGTLVMTSRDLKLLIQIADITGTWGITFLMSLVSAILAEFVAELPTLKHSRNIVTSTLFRSACFTAGLLALASLYGAIRLVTLPQSETSLDVVIVQQNADPWEDGGVPVTVLQSQQLTEEAIASAGKKPDLVIWSESVLSWPPYRENRLYYGRTPKDYPFAQFMQNIDTPLLVGSTVVVDPENDGMSNSAILIAPDGTQLDWHAKVQLVPFAEYMPFTEYEFVRTFFDAIVGFSRGWVPGTSVEPMVVTDKKGREIRIATPICFEDAFPALNARAYNRGSDLIINLTNDAWSKTDSAEMQHFTIASFRSIELRTTLVRSTNGGYSVVVDPSGTVIADLPLFKSTSLFTTVPVFPHVTTFYARFGDWFPSLLCLLLLFAATARFVVDTRKLLR